MTITELIEQFWGKLDELGFEGTDASMTESVVEYGGLWSERYGVAMLVETDREDPGVMFYRITAADIAMEIERAGQGFLDVVDAKNCGIPTGMDAILAMKGWCGGWHQNSAQWRRLSQWTTHGMLTVLENMCKNES